MSTRARLEERVRELRERLDNVPADTPQEIIDDLESEYRDLSFELNNLYDDQVNEFTQ